MHENIYATDQQSHLPSQQIRLYKEQSEKLNDIWLLLFFFSLLETRKVSISAKI